MVDAILELRAQLSAAGLDAGPQTILHHLAGRFDKTPCRVTVWRILKRQGRIAPEPHKRPKASFTRFEAELPNQLWQTDATEWRLADSSKVEILNLIDDHSRLCLASVAVPTVKAADAVECFYLAAEEFGLPARFLSDNAAVFSGKSRRGRVALESELDRLGVQCVHSTPYHPQTCGKVERFHQTLKLFLAKQAPPDRWLICNCSSTPSEPSTTSSDRIALSMAAPRCRLSTLVSRPHLPWPSLRSTTAFAATASMLAAASPCATSAGYAISTSATSTGGSQSCSWSPALTSASSPRTASCCAN